MLQPLGDSAAKATAQQFLEIVGEATATLESQRSSRRIAGGEVDGDLVDIHEAESVAIISDLHGDMESLLRILSGIDHESFLANPANKMIFLGDYVDRGSDSLGVMYSICHLKCAHPDAVVLMRGNHEAPSEFPFSSHDLPHRIIERFGNSEGRAIYTKILSMFGALTAGTIVNNRLLLVHGGLPTDEGALSNWRESIATAQKNHTRNRVLEELLWNDPRQVNSRDGWEDSRRGIGRHFGSSVTSKWLQASGTKAVVRGHEPCQGFRIDHEGMILTLFSCTEAYPGFKAAFLKVSGDKLATLRNANDLLSYVKFRE